MTLQYCPNGECVNFRCEVDTNNSRCVMCAWGLVPVKKQTDPCRTRATVPITNSRSSLIACWSGFERFQESCSRNDFVPSPG